MYPRLVALAHALAGPAFAADLAQESMLVAYRRREDVQRFDSPVGWVRGVCAHHAVSSVRRGLAEARALTRLRSRHTPDEVTASADDDHFWQEVRRLPRRQAQVVALHLVTVAGARTPLPASSTRSNSPTEGGVHACVLV